MLKHTTMKMYRECLSKAPCILEGVSGQPHALGKVHWIGCCMSHYNRSGCGAADNNSYLYWESNPSYIVMLLRALLAAFLALFSNKLTLYGIDVCPC